MAEPSAADTTITPETVAETPPPETTKDASPSEATSQGEKKETLLEAVLKAVQPKEGEEEGSEEASPTSEDSAPSEAKAKEEEAKEADLSKDPDEAELSKYKESTRQRIMQLIEQRNAFRADADVTKTLRDFLVTNDIAREDFQLTLDLAAAMRRGDFQTFLQGVGPYVQLATQALGLSLPPDLHAEVQARRMSPDAAAQMSRDRYARVMAEQNSNRATAILTNQQSVQQQQQLAHAIESGVTTWEQGVRAADPDYGRKEATVRNFLWAVVRERGNPQSPEQAVQIAQEAYARANETLRSFAPQPRATRAVPSSVNRSAGVTRSEPKSMMEAALLGLERANGRA